MTEELVFRGTVGNEVMEETSRKLLEKDKEQVQQSIDKRLY